ncbi:MAG: peptide chain release factor N(5)-glutamine methyltransferase [bacterium]|nr:peptide chain release factor N(5)-glutamine methyltransferase [bacterium]
MATSVAQYLARAADRIASISETPRVDAEILLAHTLGCTRAQLLARLKESVDAPNFDALVQRRLDCEPIAYILGDWEFYSMTFLVGPPTLVPRPETEHLVEAVLDHIGEGPARVLELGTGTGCVALALAANAPACHVLATDIAAQALELASRNAEKHALTGRVSFAQGDLFEAVPDDAAPYDAVCSNPPYVETGAWPELSPVIRRHEDPDALLAGPDGLDVIRRIARDAQTYLKPGGLLAFEMGMGQTEAVCTLLEQHGYADIDVRPDLAGIGRVALARKPGP